MKKLVLGLISLGTAAFLALSAQAADFAGVKAKMTTARENLVSLLDASDAAAQDQFIANIAAATKDVDASLVAAVGEGGANAAAVKDLKDTWDLFKNTRDNELVPMVKSGKKDDAKTLAKGVQAERFKKMMGLLGQLGAS